MDGCTDTSTIEGGTRRRGNSGFHCEGKFGIRRKVLENAESTLKDLSDSPGSGSPFESDQPELAHLRFRRVKGFPNHLVFYVEHTNAIEVVRILHGARDLDTELRKTC